MHIDFNAAFDDGMSEKDIWDMMQKQLQERNARKEEAAKEQSEKDRVEALKAEGRAYLINAALAYAEAFGILESSELTDEELAELEQKVKTIEEMVPLYLKMYELQDRMDDSFFKGLF